VTSVDLAPKRADMVITALPNVSVMGIIYADFRTKVNRLYADAVNRFADPAANQGCSRAPGVGA
jgi:hypothetical protein